MKYRKKPVEIEAIEWEGDNEPEIREFVGNSLKDDHERSPDYLCIMTLEGPIYAYLGDFIIKGVKGEFYPCKPYIFNLTYDPVEEK